MTRQTAQCISSTVAVCTASKRTGRRGNSEKRFCRREEIGQTYFLEDTGKNSILKLYGKKDHKDSKNTRNRDLNGNRSERMKESKSKAQTKIPTKRKIIS